MTPYERLQKALQEIGGIADEATPKFVDPWNVINDIAKLAADALVEAHRLNLQEQLQIAKAAIEELKNQIKWGGPAAQKRASDIIGSALIENMLKNPDFYVPPEDQDENPDKT